jgi:uncharacterized protein
MHMSQVTWDVTEPAQVIMPIPESDIWLNLSTSDVQACLQFYQALGFQASLYEHGAQHVSMKMGTKGIQVCIFPEGMMEKFMNHPVTDVSKSNELLISIGVESVAEVDELAAKAKAAGGTLYAQPSYTDGWMYGCGIVDPDGHRLNAVYMDMEKLPKPGRFQLPLAQCPVSE